MSPPAPVEATEPSPVHAGFTVGIDKQEKRAYQFIGLTHEEDLDNTMDSSGPSSEPILVPFTVGVKEGMDQCSGPTYTFEGMRANADKKNAPLIVRTQRVHLPTGHGDYTIVELPKIGIERKSKEDLYGSIGQRRANFEDRLSRMAGVSGLWYSAIVIEAEFSELLTEPPPFSNLNPKSLTRTILAWQMRWSTVGWWFMPNRSAAEGLTFRLLERFWDVHGAKAEEVNRIEAAGEFLGCPEALELVRTLGPPSPSPIASTGRAVANQNTFLA